MTLGAARTHYQSRVPIKYREWKVTVFLMLATTTSITVLSYLSGRPGTTASLTAAGGVVSGVSAALTAWQKDSSADRKINRYTNAIINLENHLLWWDTLPPVDQNSQPNINRLVSTGESIKLVSASSLCNT